MKTVLTMLVIVMIASQAMAREDVPSRRASTYVPMEMVANVKTYIVSLLGFKAEWKGNSPAPLKGDSRRNDGCGSPCGCSGCPN